MGAMMLKQAMEFADQIVDPVNFESETLEEIGVQLKDFKTNLEKNSGKVGIAIEIIAQELLRRHYGMKVGDVIASVNRNGTVREFFFQRFQRRRPADLRVKRYGYGGDRRFVKSGRPGCVSQVQQQLRLF